MRWIGLCAAGAALAAASGAAHANLMWMTCNGQQVFHVEDNGWYDDDPAVNSIRYAFLITPESGAWVASGTISGVFVPGQSAITTITGWRVFRLGGTEPVLSDTITWGQQFDALPGATTSSSLEGRYDSFSHMIGGTDLVYQAGAMAGAQAFPLSAIAPGFASGPGPVPFSGACAPIAAAGMDRQYGGLTLRLDAVGDVIEATRDINIVSQVPAPAGLVVLAAGAALAAKRRRAAGP
jgi:hypothetical protein